MEGRKCIAERKDDGTVQKQNQIIPSVFLHNLLFKLYIKNEAKIQNRDVRNKVKKLTPVISEETTDATLNKNISDQKLNQRANFTDWLTPFSVTTITYTPFAKEEVEI